MISRRSRGERPFQTSQGLIGMAPQPPPATVSRSRSASTLSLVGMTDQSASGSRFVAERGHQEVAAELGGDRHLGQQAVKANGTEQTEALAEQWVHPVHHLDLKRRQVTLSRGGIFM